MWQVDYNCKVRILKHLYSHYGHDVQRYNSPKVSHQKPNIHSDKDLSISEKEKKKTQNVKSQSHKTIGKQQTTLKRFIKKNNATHWHIPTMPTEMHFAFTPPEIPIEDNCATFDTLF